MQSDKSAKRGARTHRPKKDDEVLSPLELARVDRGLRFKRAVRSEAARHDLYDDAAIADAVGVSRNTVGAWWKGAQPSPDALVELARVMDMRADELFALLYVPPSGPAGLQEGVRRGRGPQGPADPDTPARSRTPQPRGEGEGRA
jgi:transcriptional regulator with XRE-family HTH domain